MPRSSIAPEIVPPNSYSTLEAQHPGMEAAYTPVHHQSYQSYHHQAPEPKPAYVDTSPMPQTSRGQGKWSVAALASLLTAVVVGAALGGGLGSTLINCRNEKCALSDNSGSDASLSTLTVTGTTTTTTTEASAAATNTATPSAVLIPAAPTNVPLLDLLCINGSVSETAHRTATFLEHCGIDFGSNHVSTTKDDSGTALSMVDILGIIAYSPSDCYQACLTLDDYHANTRGDSSTHCRSIVFNAKLADSAERNGANCWIKNGTPSDIGALTQYSDKTFLSAELVQ
ncbi:hypothetical protein H2200_000087 [Cladophialophora chaetospira]|uniref:Uncharacterized protein n=1 Tax=Cladophialophora chaetospira TaxID=386627 RepID=A0AA38XMW1_9EURO|nr:hypothetical protein H2200_000087 [Cladophialophora chaetospira]